MWEGVSFMGWWTYSSFAMPRNIVGGKSQCHSTTSNSLAGRMPAVLFWLRTVAMCGKVKGGRFMFVRGLQHEVNHEATVCISVRPVGGVKLPSLLRAGRHFSYSTKP